MITSWVKEHTWWEQWDLDEWRPPLQPLGMESACTLTWNCWGSDRMNGSADYHGEKDAHCSGTFCTFKELLNFFCWFSACLQGRWDQLKHGLPLNHSSIPSTRSPSPLWGSAGRKRWALQGSWLKGLVSEPSLCRRSEASCNEVDSKAAKRTENHFSLRHQVHWIASGLQKQNEP